MEKRYRKKLYLSILLFILSAFLLYQVSLGWFASIRQTNTDPFYLSNEAVNLYLYQGIDSDANGVPDTDENDEILYTVISSDNVVINNVYPLYTVAYKAYYQVTASGGYCNLSLTGLSLPNPQTPDVDITKAMRIKYTNPATSQVIDTLLFDVMDENRAVSVLSGYHLSGGESLSFQFSIYMDPAAGNQYKNQLFEINKIVLSVTQE